MVDLMNDVINGAFYPGAIILALILLGIGSYAIKMIFQAFGKQDW